MKYHFIPAHLNLRSLRNLKTSCLRFSSATTTPPLPQSFSAVIGRPVWFSTNGRSWLAHMTAGLYCGQTGRQAVGLTKLLLLLGRAFFKKREKQFYLQHLQERPQVHMLPQNIVFTSPIDVKLLPKWSPFTNPQRILSGHQEVTEWSPICHQVVSKCSPSGS